MERSYIGGLPLAAAEIEPAEVQPTAALIAQAMADLHRLGIAHGAIHARNVILTADGVTLTDIGLSGRELLALCGRAAWLPSIQEDRESMQKLFLSMGAK